MEPKFFFKISDHQQSRPLQGPFLIPPALLVVADCDLGEGFASYRIGRDDEVMPHFTSANVACGWHAGDPMVMDYTVQLASILN